MSEKESSLKESNEEKQIIKEEGEKDFKKKPLIYDKFLELKKKHENKEETNQIQIKEEIQTQSKKIRVPKMIGNYYIEKESNNFDLEKKPSENENISRTNSIISNNSTNKKDFLDLNESVVNKLRLMVSQYSFSADKKDDLLSSVDFDINQSSKLIKDYEVSPFPEEENEEEEDNIEENNINNIYTNIKKLKNNIPLLNEGEFINIEKETQPLIKEYEKFFNFKDSGDIIITKKEIMQYNETSIDSINENNNNKYKGNKNSQISKGIYFEYDNNNIEDEKYLNDFIKKRWKYLVKLIIIEKNRKVDEYRKFIISALMKYQFKKNNKLKIEEINFNDYNNKNIILRKHKERNKNFNNITNIDLIKNEPLPDLINEDEIIDDIKLFKKQKKLRKNREQIETKFLTKKIDVKSKLRNLFKKYEEKENKKEEGDEMKENTNEIGNQNREIIKNINEEEIEEEEEYEEEEAEIDKNINKIKYKNKKDELEKSQVKDNINKKANNFKNNRDINEEEEYQEKTKENEEEEEKEIGEWIEEGEEFEEQEDKLETNNVQNKSKNNKNKINAKNIYLINRNNKLNDNEFENENLNTEEINDKNKTQIKNKMIDKVKIKNIFTQKIKDIEINIKKEEPKEKNYIKKIKYI